MATNTVDSAEIATSDVFLAEEGLTGATGVYEVGYHLLPSLSDADRATATKEIAAFLSEAGATFIGDHAPEHLDLAYPIQKRVNGKLTSFSEAYFGWVAFEVERSKMAGLTAFLDAHAAVLRYICISTTRDEVKAVVEGAILMPTAVASKEAIKAPKRATEESAPVSDEMLGVALETMASEDEKKA